MGKNKQLKPTPLSHSYTCNSDQKPRPPHTQKFKGGENLVKTAHMEHSWIPTVDSRHVSIHMQQRMGLLLKFRRNN